MSDDFKEQVIALHKANNQVGLDAAIAAQAKKKKIVRAKVEALVDKIVQEWFLENPSVAPPIEEKKEKVIPKPTLTLEQLEEHLKSKEVVEPPTKVYKSKAKKIRINTVGYCLCGCGEFTKGGNQFLRGHGRMLKIKFRSANWHINKIKEMFKDVPPEGIVYAKAMWPETLAGYERVLEGK